MAESRKGLSKRLKQLGVDVDVQDNDTMILRNVPTNQRCFNKAHTNLLVTRPQAEMPFLVCVDHDLAYLGKEVAIARSFSGGHVQKGWRVLYIEHKDVECEKVLQTALAAVGFGGSEPALPSPRPARRAKGNGSEAARPRPLLGAFGTSLSEQVRSDHAEPTIGREEKIEEVVSCLFLHQVRLPVILGASGVGKTNLLYGVTRRVMASRPQLSVVSADLGVLMSGTLFESERENLLKSLLDEVCSSDHLVLAMEHIEQAFAGVPRGSFILGQAIDQGAKLIGTVLPQFRAIFEMAPLARRLQMVELAETTLDQTVQTLLALRQGITDHHGLAVDESFVTSVVATAEPAAGAFPSKAIDLLDATAARTVLAGDNELSLYYLSLAASRLGRDED